MAVVVAVSAAVVPTSAPAYGGPVLTSSGVRCTVVGTPGPDTLHGTRNRDVICGRGGNDRIDGRGGDDLIEGGRGADTVLGSDGDDRILGGAGNDRLSGGEGDDVVLGGAGNDVLTGDSGDDVLRGQDGNDDLDGGYRATDVIDGGPGTNWCTADLGVDHVRSCTPDLAAPRVAEVRVSAGHVDVTDAIARVTVRTHLTDDTGITGSSLRLTNPAGVVVKGTPRLVQGTIRDGWWASTVTVFRGIDPGPMTAVVGVWDRSGRDASAQRDAVLTVTDRSVDQSPPTVVSAESPQAEQVYDVSSSTSVDVWVRVTDAGSGVGGSEICFMLPDSDGGWTGLHCDRQSVNNNGSRHDGLWRSTLDLMAHTRPVGTWNISVTVWDRAHPGVRRTYLGPDAYQAAVAEHPDDPSIQPLPDGVGRIQVVDTSDPGA